MSLTKSMKLAGVLCPLTLLLIFCPMLSAQTAQPARQQIDRDQTLRQLLTEVRELRLALQHATVTNARFQMLFERLKAQQSQVEVINRDLSAAREQLAKLRLQKVEIASRVKELEERLEQSSGEEHNTIDRSLKGLKQWQEAEVGEEQRQAQIEADLTMRFQVEQGRINELNGQLDVLMNEWKSP